MKMLTEERKKQLDVDLWIIVIVSTIVLATYIFFNKQINELVYDTSINILLRVLFVGVIFQFGLAGFGITIVSILRRESFLDYGLRKEKLLQTIVLSILCCVPDFVYRFFAGDTHQWFPFWDVNTTREVIASGFPYNVLGMLVTAVCWGFFEGFNYVVICKKINERYPSANKWLDWGAIVCAVMCILVHGAVGVTPDAIMDMCCTLFLIYGMLMVYKKTGNAWGCVLIFIAYWNAV